MHTLTRPVWVRWFDAFLYKPAYFFLVALLTIYSNVFGGELFTYTCFTLIFLYLCFFGRDYLPILPLAICSYISPSRNNNPGVNDASVFSYEVGGVYITILAVSMIICFIYRLIRDEELGRKAFWTCKRQLLPGILLLCGSYLFSGFGSVQQILVGKQNLLFAAIQCVSIFVLYFVMTAMVKWEQAPTAYLAWTGMCVGYVLLAELVNIYISNDVIRYNIIYRDHIYTGWGHYNNIGGVLAMMIPFPFFLTGKGKHSSIFYISALLFLVGVVLTCSRASIICGAITYIVSYVLSLVHSRNARANVLIHTLTVLGSIAIYVLYADKLLQLFHDLLVRGMGLSGRSRIYEAGLHQFLCYPVFGGSFYPVDYHVVSWYTSDAFLSLFPPRWHNTFVQILASCGIVGFCAYIYHRFQTLCLFLRRPSGKKMFAFLSMLTLLATSMLDCHMFNVGPVLFYSMMLAFVEKKLNQ